MEINVRAMPTQLVFNEYWTEILQEILYLLMQDLKCHQDEPYFDSYQSKIQLFLRRLYKSKMSLNNKIIIKKVIQTIKI